MSDNKEYSRGYQAGMTAAEVLRKYQKQCDMDGVEVGVRADRRIEDGQRSGVGARATSRLAPVDKGREQ